MNSSKNSHKKSLAKPKVIVILGPTASGKSDLAVKLAKYIGGLKQTDGSFARAEIISADSRQVYKGLNIGTGKITRKEMHGIPHHLLDVADPKKTFTVVDYQKLAMLALRDILRRGKIPIICGGTGFYIDALIYNYQLPAIKPNLKLRKKLERLSATTLFAMLRKKDSRRAKNIDSKNPRRLIRALEIVLQSQKPVPSAPIKTSPYQVSKLGIAIPWQELQKKIVKRLHQRIKAGLLSEVSNLHKRGLSWQRMRELGLEYRYAAEYLTGKVPTKQKFESSLAQAIKQYAKRQMTWFKRDKDILWLSNQKTAQKTVAKFFERYSRPK